MLSDVAGFFISSFFSTLILGVLFSVGELFSAKVYILKWFVLNIAYPSLIVTS